MEIESNKKLINEITWMPYDVAVKVSQLMNDNERFNKEKDPDYEMSEFRAFKNETNNERSTIVAYDNEGYKSWVWDLPIPNLDNLAQKVYSLDESRLRRLIASIVEDKFSAV